jgi:hypothetical protein
MRLRRVNLRRLPLRRSLHVGKPVVTLLSLSCTRVLALLWAQRQRMQKALWWRTVVAAAKAARCASSGSGCAWSNGPDHNVVMDAASRGIRPEHERPRPHEVPPC